MIFKISVPKFISAKFHVFSLLFWINFAETFSAEIILELLILFAALFRVKSNPEILPGLS